MAATVVPGDRAGATAEPHLSPHRVQRRYPAAGACEFVISRAGRERLIDRPIPVKIADVYGVFAAVSPTETMGSALMSRK